MWSKLKAFLRGWWYTRTQRDPEVVAKALGRPDTLELTQDQADCIESLFCGEEVYDDDGNNVIGTVPGLDPAATARAFYKLYPRTEFRFFMVPDPDGQTLQFTKPDYEFEASYLIEAAMKKLGAIVTHEDENGKMCEYMVNAHPMVQRFAEIASKVEIPQPKGRGILG